MPDFTWLQTQLDERRAQQLLRQPLTFHSPQGSLLETDGQKLLNFSSNDYLGLAADPRVQEAFIQGARRWGVGSGASHLVCGHFGPHEELEQRLAAWTGRPAALLFTSGYQANLAAIQTLFRAGDRVFQDYLNHASLLDAGLASGARFQRYRHLSMSHLATLLQKPSSGRTLVVSDSVFSMDGDQADLEALTQLCAQHSSWLLIDDAHGLGVLGSRGEGSAGEKYPASQVHLYMGTLGKALGTAGAFIAGETVVIDYLRQFARTHIYTTAQPPALACATLRSLSLLEEEPERREHLFALIQYFRQEAKRIELPLLPSQTPIQPLLLGTSELAVHWSQQLREAGFLVVAIRPPTVPVGKARLRVTLTAGHSYAEVDQLLEQLRQLHRAAPPLLS